MIRLANPEYLWLLVPVLALLLWHAAVLKSKINRRRIFVRDELNGLVNADYNRFRLIGRNVLFYSGLFLLVLALSGIQVGSRYEEIKVEGMDIVLALDISSSMNAQDVKPSRLEKAKHEMQSLLNRLSGDRVALVIFAGDAFLQCPMTTDYGAIRLFLESITTSVTTSVGTNFEAALETALAAFPKENEDAPSRAAGRAIVFFSDGEDHNPASEKKIADLKDVTVFTIGVGTEIPAPIPVYDDNGQLKDYKKRGGQAVTTRLEEALLKKMAEETSGAYYRATMDESEMDALYKRLSAMGKTESHQYRYTEYEDRYQWFLLIAILCLLGELILRPRKNQRDRKSYAV